MSTALIPINIVMTEPEGYTAIGTITNMDLFKGKTLSTKECTVQFFDPDRVEITIGNETKFLLNMKGRFKIYLSNATPHTLAATEIMKKLYVKTKSVDSSKNCPSPYQDWAKRAKSAGTIKTKICSGDFNVENS